MSNIHITKIYKDDFSLWDSYVYNHPESNLYHLSAWLKVINKTYKHEAIYLVAKKDKKIVGILPIFRIKHFIFGDSLTSIPFFDMGGILADSREASEILLNKIVSIGSEINTDKIELRCSLKFDHFHQEFENSGFDKSVQTNKVRMLLELPSKSEDLLKSFKAKLRSQIQKPIKEGLTAKIGYTELIDDFYKIFLINMRDLGSPVHSKKMMINTLLAFPKTSKVVIVYKKKIPVAGGIIIEFKKILQNPWASSLREYSRQSPNMLLYWTMLKYACDNNYNCFDFGRSTPGEGTHRFKKQWGATESPLYWYNVLLKHQNNTDTTPSKFDKAIKYWKKLPIPVTQFLGPMIRKNISF